eukprot:3012808-Rhodomonas_salina.1
MRVQYRSGLCEYSIGVGYASTRSLTCLLVHVRLPASYPISVPDIALCHTLSQYAVSVPDIAYSHARSQYAISAPDIAQSACTVLRYSDSVWLSAPCAVGVLG